MKEGFSSQSYAWEMKVSKMSKKRPIVVIVAMESELKILKNMTKAVKQIEEPICKNYEMDLNGYPVVLCCSGVGCIQAAAAVTNCIIKYNPIAIINCGLAGALREDLHLYDIVVGTEIINIHSIKTSERKEENSVDWELVTFCEGEEDRLKIEKPDESLVRCIQSIEKDYDKGKIVYDRIGSGDVWTAGTERIKTLRDTYHIACEEMEGIAIYQIANRYHIPVVGIRVISDNAVTGEEYNKETGKDLQEFVIKLLEEYAKKDERI